MFQISRKVEYALFALVHLRRHPDTPLSAKELANYHGLSYEFLARVLQNLARRGLLMSSLGSQGGYQLQLQILDQLSFLDFYEMIEGPLALVRCQQQEGQCDLRAQCVVEPSLQELQRKIRQFCASLSLRQLIDERLEVHSKLKPTEKIQEEHSTSLYEKESDGRLAGENFP